MKIWSPTTGRNRTDYSDSRMLSAFEEGEQPAAFVKWLGEKYDPDTSEGVGVMETISLYKILSVLCAALLRLICKA